MLKYVLRNAVKMHMEEDELIILQSETGFSGKGNKHAHKVLECFKEPKTEEEAAAQVCLQYDSSQAGRIRKSTGNIIKWALERNLLTAEEI